MKILNMAGQLALAAGEDAVDVEQASERYFRPERPSDLRTVDTVPRVANSVTGEPAMPVEPATRCAIAASAAGVRGRSQLSRTRMIWN